MRYLEIHERCNVCGKQFYGIPINVHGSYEYINHTNFSYNIGVMFRRTKHLPRNKRVNAIAKEFFMDGNKKITKEDAIEFLECFRHYKCEDKDLLADILKEIETKI